MYIHKKKIRCQLAVDIDLKTDCGLAINTREYFFSSQVLLNVRECFENVRLVHTNFTSIFIYMYERIYIYNLKYRFAYSEILVFMIIPSWTYKINEYTFYSWQSKQNRLKVA